jgi:hypothetical protein
MLAITKHLPVMTGRNLSLTVKLIVRLLFHIALAHIDRTEALGPQTVDPYLLKNPVNICRQL